MESYRLTTLKPGQVPQVVALHLRAFPGFFLSSLGPAFLALFYGAFPRDEDAVSFVAVDSEGMILGVVVGSLHPRGFFRRLALRRGWAFAKASLGALVRRPALVLRLLRALAYRGEVVEARTRALLSSVAVDPSAQGCGAGRALVSRWVQEVRARGAEGCYLTTDAQGNDSVNAFYERLGWQRLYGFETPEGRGKNVFVYDFSSTDDGG